MKVGDLYRFKSPLVHYLAEYSGRFFVITDVKKNGKGDFDVYEIRMMDNAVPWVFTGHELAYISEKVKADKKCP